MSDWTNRSTAKLYLFLCLAMLAIEGGLIVVKAPTPCRKCRGSLAIPSREVPDFCQTCADLLRTQFYAPCLRCRRPIGERGLLVEYCSPCTEDIAKRLGMPDEVAREVASATASGAVRTPYHTPYAIDPTNPVVRLVLSRGGEVDIELFVKQSPLATANFLRYVREGLYRGVIVSRVEWFLVQTGRYTGGYGDPIATISTIFPPVKNEAGNGLEHRVGTVGLPRADADPDSGCCDFFFNLALNTGYNRTGSAPNEAGYSCFGQVVRGFEVIDGLRREPLMKNPPPNLDKLPLEPLRILDALELRPSPGAESGSVAALGSPSLVPQQR